MKQQYKKTYSIEEKIRYYENMLAFANRRLIQLEIENTKHRWSSLLTGEIPKTKTTKKARK